MSIETQPTSRCCAVPLCRTERRIDTSIRSLINNGLQCITGESPALPAYRIDICRMTRSMETLGGSTEVAFLDLTMED